MISGPSLPSDPLGVLLSSIRARAIVVLNETYVGDWAIEIPAHDRLAEHARAGVHDIVAAFHVIQCGTAAIVQPNQRWTLHDGDVFIALHPDGHVLRGLGSTVAPTPLHRVMAALPHPAVAAASAPTDTTVLCGLFVLERAATMPLHRHLRTNIHLPRARRRHGTALSDAITPPTPHTPGWQFTTARLLELLLADALTNDPAHLPFTAGTDDHVTTAIELIDADPARAWTVAALADACAVSPSWLTARCRTTLGTSPMRLVLDRRLRMAADLLLHSNSSVECIGHQIGFSNQPAFTRAFKRHYGAPPSDWRTTRREPADRRDPALGGV